MGLIRVLDRQRRLIIPKEVLKATGIEPGDMVELWVGQNTEGSPAVMLCKRQDACLFCGSTGGLVGVQEKFICAECTRSAVYALKGASNVHQTALNTASNLEDLEEG